MLHWIELNWNSFMRHYTLRWLSIKRKLAFIGQWRFYFPFEMNWFRFFELLSFLFLLLPEIAFGKRWHIMLESIKTRKLLPLNGRQSIKINKFVGNLFISKARQRVNVVQCHVSHWKLQAKMKCIVRETKPMKHVNCISGTTRQIN